MKMYIPSLEGCKRALKIKPDFVKPMHIAAKCCSHIEDYDQCISYCDQILNIGAKNNDVDKQIVSLKVQAIKRKALSNSDSASKGTKDNAARIKILDAIKSRNIKLDDSDIFYDNQAIFRVKFDPVRLDAMNFLVWPVHFMFLEYDQSMIFQDFHEKMIFSLMLIKSLNTPPMKDNNQYKIDKLNVYFVGVDGKSYKVDTMKTLGEILKQDKFIVRHGLPLFDIVVTDSKTEAALLFMTPEEKRKHGRL